MNRVCFCFPLPFLPLPEGSSPPSKGGVSFPEAPDVPHAGLTGAASPKILRNDWFPFTEPFGARVVADEGSSGNADFDKLGGAGFLAVLLELVGLLGTGTGVRDPDAEALALADQGVVC